MLVNIVYIQFLLCHARYLYIHLLVNLGKGGRRGGGRQLLPPPTTSTTSPKPQHNRDTAATNSHSPPPMKIKWTPKAYSDSEGEEEGATVQVGGAEEGTLQGGGEIPIDNPSSVDNSLKVSSCNPTTAATSSDEEPVPVVGKWRVKQIPADDSPPGGSGEQEERVGVKQVPADNKWRVKQVPADNPASAEPQQKWRVKQVEETPVVQEDVPVTDNTPTQNKWTVKQVSESSGETTPPEDNATPTVASVQRSGTFTKMDRKIVRPSGDRNHLRMKWTPRDPSPASSEEDLHQGEGEGPNFTSYPTLTRPGNKEETTPTQRGMSPIQRGISPLQRGVSPHQRGVSPVRHGTSPLQYNRGSPGKALNRTSRSPSPSPLTTPTSSLRPPSPARTPGNNGGQNRRQLPTPNRIRSPRQQMTPPTGVSRQGQSNTRPQMTTPPQRSGLVTPKTTPTSSTRGSGLVGPKGRGPPRPISQGIPMSRPIRGGASQQRVARQPVVKPSTEEGWLDDCY